MKTVTDVVNDIRNNNDALTIRHKMAEMVSHLCAKYNLSKAELAKETGLNPITITRLLDKAHTPGREVISKIVEYDMKNSEAAQKENKPRGSIEMEVSKETKEKILAIKGSSDAELRNNTTNLITNIIANTDYDLGNLADFFGMTELELKDIYMKNVVPTDYILEQLVEYTTYKHIQFDLFKVKTDVDANEVRILLSSIKSKDNSKTISNVNSLINAIRIKNGYKTIEDLAINSGIHRSTLHRNEVSKRTYHHSTIVALIKHALETNTDISWLLVGKETNKASVHDIAALIVKDRQLGLSKIKEIVIKIRELTGLSIVSMSEDIPLGKSSLWYAMKEERLLSVRSLMKILEYASNVGIVVDPVTLAIDVIDPINNKLSAKEYEGDEVLTHEPFKLDHIELKAPSADYDGDDYDGEMTISHGTANIIDRLNIEIIKRLRSISEKHIESINIKHFNGDECITIELKDGCVLTMSTPPKK